VRLEQLAELEGDGVEIEWRSFLLRPEAEERDPEKFATYTKSWERPAGLEPAAKFNTPWSGEHAPPSHSMPAAVAGKVAMAFGPEATKAFHEALLNAYFVENRTISERSVLVEVAGEAGIDREKFGELYDAHQVPLTQRVIEDHNLAINSGVTGVPAVVVDGRYLIGGAVDVEEYQRALVHVREERRLAASDH
jgi:predicted DsbA family dithiol-disulfide isomerase